MQNNTIGWSAPINQLSKIRASKLRRRGAHNGINGHGPCGRIQAPKYLTLPMTWKHRLFNHAVGALPNTSQKSTPPR
jgi:hypothetical protein